MQYGPDSCVLCLRASVATHFAMRATIDYRGIYSDMVRQAQKWARVGTPACEACANAIRSGDAQGLADRLDVYELKAGDTKEVEIAKLSLGSTARLNQMTYALGTHISKEVVHLYDEIVPAARVLCDLRTSSQSGYGFPKFANGVDLYASLFHDAVLHVEDIRSASRHGGHAGRVMRLLVASADLHEVELTGYVEAHTIDGSEPGMTDEELYEWYQRIGFVREGPLPNSIFRHPVVEESTTQRRRRLGEAQAASLHTPSRP